MKQLKITSFFICLLLMGLVIAGNSQTVKKDANGNFYSVGNDTRKTGATKTGKTYTDSKGNVFEVWESVRGKLFIIRMNKITGKQYKSYLKLEN